MPGSQVLSDGLACFRTVTTANCDHKFAVNGASPQRPAAVPLDQHVARQPEDQLLRHLSCLQLALRGPAAMTITPGATWPACPVSIRLMAGVNQVDR